MLLPPPLQVMTAATVADVYAHANSDAVVTLLMHKIMRAAETQVG